MSKSTAEKFVAAALRYHAHNAECVRYSVLCPLDKKRASTRLRLARRANALLDSLAVEEETDG